MVSACDVSGSTEASLTFRTFLIVIVLLASCHYAANGLRLASMHRLGPGATGLMVPIGALHTAQAAPANSYSGSH